MVVNIEFFDGEPLENIVTCMNYQVDKLIYVGYQEMIEERGDYLEEFLRAHCGIKEIDWRIVLPDSLEDVLAVLGGAIEREQGAGHTVYFDVTGGDDLILVAAGMLSREYGISLHKFDVENNRLLELSGDADDFISRRAAAQKVSLDLDTIVRLHGGVINERLHKLSKEVTGDQYAEDLEKLWKIADGHWDIWNPFTGFLARYMGCENLSFDMPSREMLSILQTSNNAMKKISQFNEIVDALAKEGLLYNVVHEDGKYRFTCKDPVIRDCLQDGGMILELHTFRMENTPESDCRIGVHLDWDGCILDDQGEDVLNEIDVLKLEGNVLTFISCKTGKMSANPALHALYELETVASRFGGKYAKKLLVTVHPLTGSHLERARELGIETVQYQ